MKFWPLVGTIWIYFGIQVGSRVPYASDESLEMITQPCYQYRCTAPATVNRTFDESGAPIFSESSVAASTLCDSSRLLLLTKAEVTGKKVWDTCCSFGAVPATLDGKQDMTCALRLHGLAGYKSGTKTAFFTGFRDMYLNGTFMSCPSGQQLQGADVWEDGEPDNYRGMENFAALNLCSSCGTAKYRDVQAQTPARVICQITRRTAANQKYADIADNMITNIKSCSALTCSYIAAASGIIQSDSINISLMSMLRANNATFVAKKTCGNKLFFITKQAVSADQAWRECCKLGGIPATPDTREEIQCLQEKQITIEGYVRNTTRAWYHTGYVDVGQTRSFTTCTGSKRALPWDLWAEGEPDNYRGMEGAVAIDLCPSCSSQGYSDVSGLMNLRVICEFDKKYMPFYTLNPNELELLTPKPPSCSGRSRRKLALKDGLVEVSKKISLANLVCGKKQFIVTKDKVTSKVMWPTCCSINMVPAIFDSAEEYACFIQNVKTLDTDDLWHVNYMDLGMNRSYVCPSSGATVPPSTWALGQPNNWNREEVCIGVNPCPDCANSGMHDMLCRPRRNLVCERKIGEQEKPTVTGVGSTLSGSRRLDILPKYDLARIDKELAAISANYAPVCNTPPRVGANGLLLEDGKNQIALIGEDCGGKQFVLTEAVMEYKLLWQTCCKFGTVPALVESKRELDCLKKLDELLQEETSRAVGFYHVGYYDLGHNFSYVSPSSGKRIPEELWAAGQPDNWAGLEACGGLHLCQDCDQPFGFHDRQCSAARRLVCEHRLPRVTAAPVTAPPVRPTVPQPPVRPVQPVLTQPPLLRLTLPLFRPHG